MSPASSLDWLYYLLGYSLAAAGLTLLLWSLLWDRSRGRRRCPKCWYDMAGVPGRQCPECGREARRESALTRTRRHPRWGVLAILIGASGYVVSTVPRLRDHGWVGAVPTTYLVFAAPLRGQFQSPNARLTNLAAMYAAATNSTSSAPSLTTAELLNAETWRRIENGSAWRWQSQAFLDRAMQADGLDPMDVMRVPTDWPMGVPIPCRARPGFGSLTVRIRPESGKAPLTLSTNPPRPRTVWSLTAINTPSSSVRAVLEFVGPTGSVVYRRAQSLPVNAALPLETFLTRMDSPEATAAVQDVLRPHLADHGGRLELILFHRPGTERRILPFIAAFICEVRYADRVLRMKRDVAPCKGTERVMWSAARVEWPEDAIDQVRAGNATITVRGDYDGAMGVYTSQPFEPPVRACWTGEFTMPLTMGGNPRKK